MHPAAPFAFTPSEPWWLIRWVRRPGPWYELVEQGRHAVAGEIDKMCQVHAVLGFWYPGEDDALLPCIAIAGECVGRIINDSEDTIHQSELFAGDEHAAFEARRMVIEERLKEAFAAVEKAKAEAPRGFHASGPAAAARRAKKEAE